MEPKRKEQQLKEKKNLLDEDPSFAQVPEEDLSQIAGGGYGLGGRSVTIKDSDLQEKK